MRNPIKLTIITPVYNSQRFIKDCLENVISQNCQSLEHLVIDGDSCDKTLEIVKAYAQTYPHIRFISEKDNGQYEAMNRGIKLAKGKIIGILNVDDFYEPNTLAEVLKMFESQVEPAFVCGNCRVWDKSGNLKFINKPKRCTYFNLLAGTNDNSFYTKVFPVNPAAYFYHASLHERIGFYSDLYQLLDLDFILRSTKLIKIKYVDKLWGNQLLHPDTKTMKSMAAKTLNKETEILLESYRQKMSNFDRQRLEKKIAYCRTIKRVTSFSFFKRFLKALKKNGGITLRK
ncbi:MAG: glycosyltransferase family 2 protein [Candidatus Omnitrophica bacterium]|nr:glycosyltransferase family 2 protein [Candidatus Omnitrophota bacterium]